jgi:HEAT repeat protein
MYRHACASVLFFSTLVSLGQAPTDIQTLFVQLRQEKTTNAAAQKIREQASTDSLARDFMAQKLPSMIRNRPINLVWMNAVRLAGQLKSSSTIPALKEALSLAPLRGGYDYGVSDNYPSPSEGAKLRYDIVGRALADIGDPSVPAIADVLSRGDVSMRMRAFFVLANINSPAAKQAMRDHLPNEADPVIRGLIQRELHLSE